MKEYLAKAKAFLAPILTLKNVLIFIAVCVVIYLIWVSWNAPSHEQIAVLQKQNATLQKNLEASINESNGIIKALEKRLKVSQGNIDKLNRQIQSKKVEYESITIPKGKSDIVSRFNDLGYSPR